jgi:hypothetical protein
LLVKGQAHDTETKRDGNSNASTAKRGIIIIFITDNLAPHARLPDGGWRSIDFVALYDFVQSVASRGS